MYAYEGLIQIRNIQKGKVVTMKTHTIAAAVGLALALCSQASTSWFDADISNIQSWPAQDWSNAENTTFSDGAIKLENVTNNLTYTATPSQNLDGTSTVVIKSSMLFTAYDSDEMPEPPSGIKAGLIVVDNGESTSYYGLVTNVWTALTGPTPDLTSAVEVTMSLLPGQVQYKVGTAELTAAGRSWLASNSGSSDTVSQVLYNGTGEIRTLAGDTNALPPAVAFTLTWPSGLTPVSYSVDGGEAVAISGSSPVSIPNLLGGEAIAFVVANADGAQKTLTGTAGTDAGINATGTTFDWPEYLGVAVNGAYTIDEFADLDMLRKGVAAGLTTAGETFKQTANIDMSTAGAFAGIGTYAKVPTSGTPFRGTYDGQNFTISNVTRAGGDTQGIFNQVGVSGVIENLVVSNMVFDASVTGEYGFAIVGNAGGGATLRNLTAAGVFASSGKPSTHNIAGIVVRVCGGATTEVATTIDSCTNNATIYGGYTKLGGICAIVQEQTGFKNGKVVFNNCANNGSLVCKRTSSGVTGNAGIIGYSSANNVELTGCYGNGVVTNSDGANTDKDGALIGWQYAGFTLTDNGGNSAPANLKMIAYYGNQANVTGFKYATVANGVATTVTTLAEGNTYLLEGNVAASETPVFTLAAAGDTIAFDTALGYTFAGTVAAASDLIVTSATSGTVTTYTAAAPVAEIVDGAKYADLADALSAATAGQTVKLLANVTASGNAVSTAAGTIDLNGKTLTLPQDSNKMASLTFTGTGAKTLKGGDLTGIYHELTITAPADEDLTLDGMTFHASVKPAGSGALFTVTNCQFLCDFDKTGAAFTDGSSADVHSYGLMFQPGDTLFAQADVVNNYFDQGRRAAVQASIAGDLYFYGNTVVADKLTSRTDGATTRYPALQTMTHGRVFIENNTFSGQYLGEAFCLYNKGTYRSTDAAVVFSGNTVGNGVNYLWGIYDADKSGDAALVSPNLYFGANTIDANVNTTACIYKTTVDGTDVNGVTYSHTPATLALPSGVASVYAWTHAAGAKDLYVNGSPADAVAAGTVIAVPGTEVTAPAGLVLTPDATLKNQWTAASAGIDPVNGTTSVEVQAESAAAATNSVSVVAPAGVDATAYKALFTFEATAVDGKPGYYEVELVGIKDEVVEAVNADAVNVFSASGDTPVSVRVPAGLFYRITPSTSLPISAQGVATQSAGSVSVQKPGTTQGFLQVELSATPFGTAVVE